MSCNLCNGSDKDSTGFFKCYCQAYIAGKAVVDPVQIDRNNYQSHPKGGHTLSHPVSHKGKIEGLTLDYKESLEEFDHFCKLLRPILTQEVEYIQGIDPETKAEMIEYLDILHTGSQNFLHQLHKLESPGPDEHKH